MNISHKNPTNAHICCKHRLILNVSLRHDSGLKGSSSGSTLDTLQQLAEVKFWILLLVNHFVDLAVEMYLSYPYEGFNMSEWQSVNNTGLLFEMIVGVLTTCHLVLHMQAHVISFYGVTSRIGFMFLLFLQVSRNWRYESEPPLKPSPLTCYKQFGMNSIIMLMFVESQRVHI